MNDKLLSKLRKHARRHDIKLFRVSRLNNSRDYEIAAAAVCNLSAVLDARGDTFGMSYEPFHDIAVAGWRVK